MYSPIAIARISIAIFVIFIIVLVGCCRRARDPHLRHALGGLIPGSTRLLWGILGSTLCLQLFSVEDTIVTEATLGQCLRLVLERIGRRFRPTVHHVQELIVFHQDKFDFAARTLDRTGLNIPTHA